MMPVSSTPNPEWGKGLHGIHDGAHDYSAWLQDSAGYLSHTLKAYNALPFWTADSKTDRVSRGRCRCRSASAIGAGSGYAAAASSPIRSFLDMFADAASASARQDAIARAEQRITPYLGS